MRREIYKKKQEYVLWGGEGPPVALRGKPSSRAKSLERRGKPRGKAVWVPARKLGEKEREKMKLMNARKSEDNVVDKKTYEPENIGKSVQISENKTLTQMRSGYI